MGQTSSQIAAPTQATQAAQPPATAKMNGAKRVHDQSTMNSNNVASERPSKKRRKAAEEHEVEVPDVAMQGEHPDTNIDAIDGGEKLRKKKKKRKMDQDAPEDAAREEHIGDDAVAAEAVDVEARSRGEKRQRRRAKKAARKAKEAAEAHPKEDMLATEAAEDGLVELEDMEVTELPAETTPIKQELSKSPTGVEWGRQQIRRMLKRKQMEELVLSGQARWHKLPNDRWSIRYYRPEEAPSPAELSPDQKRRHDLLKQEIATYEHTLRESEDQERKRRGDAAKENTAPVEEDAVAVAANEEVEAHEVMAVSPVGNPSPKRRKKRQSNANETNVAEAVRSQSGQEPEDPTVRQTTSGEKHKDDTTQTTSKQKTRRSLGSEEAGGAETVIERPERPIGAARPVPSLDNEERPRKKSRRAKEIHSASSTGQQGEQKSLVCPAAGTVGKASPKPSPELTAAPAIPTPRADHDTASKRPVSAELIRTWPDSNDTSAIVQTDFVESHVEGEADNTVSISKRKKKRKRTTDVAEDEAEYAPEADTESLNEHEDAEDEVKEKKGKKAARTKTSWVSTEKHQLLAKSLQLAVPEATTGPFTVQEQEIGDRIFDEVLQRHNFSEAELKAMIKSWRNAGPFKMEMEAALPNRKKDQIRKFCQRRYHAHERGPWTAEQDQALLNAHAKWPGKWTQIADLVDRFADDCKDRWKNYLKSGDNREVGPWNQAEEDALIKAVEECVAKIKKSRRKDKTLSTEREDLEALLDWNNVSEMLGGRRAGKRCREKYQKLMARLTKTGSLSQELPVSQLQDELADAAPKNAVVHSSKDSAAQRALERFEVGDYYDAFVEVHTAIKDHSAHYHDEQMLLGSIVAQRHPASRFNVSYLGAALRRKAIEKALDEWKIDSKKTRRKLDEAPSIPAKAFLLAKWVEKQSGDKLATLPRRYMPELIGKTKEEVQQFKTQQQEHRRAKMLKAKPRKSKDYVSESDEDGGGPPSIQADQEQKGEIEAIDDEDESSSHTDAVVPQMQERDVSVSAEDEAESQKRDTRSPTNEVENDDNECDAHNDASTQPEVEESDHDQDRTSEVVHEVSDTEVDSTHEKVFSASQAAHATQDTQEIPETQHESAHADGGEVSDSLAARGVHSPDDDIVVSSVNSRASESPSLSPQDFLQRCRDAGRSQHGEYTSRNRRTSGRQSRGRRR